MADQQGFPNINQSFVDGRGFITQAWRQFLLNLWTRTGGGSGAVFNQFTLFEIGLPVAGFVARTLVQYLLDDLNIYDFGAVGNGIADDTAAYNANVAYWNAGFTRYVNFKSGRFVINGATTVIEEGGSIFSDGFGSTEIINAGTETTPIIQFAYMSTGVDGRLDIRGLSFKCDPPTVGDRFIRPVMDLYWDTALVASQQRCNIRDIDIQKHFKSGIKLTNCIGGYFNAINMQGGPVVDGLMDYGWYITATVGHYSVACKWTACSVTTAEKCYVGDGHLEGMFFSQCEAGFSNWGWWIEASDTTYAPEWHITDCQAEVYEGGIHLKNVAWVNISDYSFYIGAGYVSGATCIEIEDSLGIIVHDNRAVGAAGALPWYFLTVRNTFNTKSHDNDISGLGANSNAYRCYPGSSQLSAINDTFNNPNASATPWNDATSVFPHMNYFGPAQTNSTLPAFSRTQGAGVNSGGSIAANTTFTIFAQILQPVWKGERFRIQAQVSWTTIAANLIGLLRIREFNHRPGSAVPFVVFETANNLTTISDMTTLESGQAGRFLVDVEVRIVGSALDALFVLELATSTSTAVPDVYSFRVEPMI